ncbi:MAG: aminotransferase class I/II-fold pyridoxal phosphate-dependent enzyme [Lachnospiraceae bacterium]|nr:aminotransferase class I/II-fold pyridoxal phosphate-dependent enzyme [Lachnospiraceae bacterium]
MAHRHGGDIYTYRNAADFSANINFRGMPASVHEAAVRAIDASVHYPDPDCRALRYALAVREESFYGTAGVYPEHMICGNGAAELMFALVGACRPRKALLAVPSFFEYEQALSAAGCEIVYFELKPEQDFTLGKDFLESVCDFSEKRVYPDLLSNPVSGQGIQMSGRLSDRDMVILGNPNNPTGQLIEKEILAKLIRICRERHILLVLDESFFDFLSEADRAETFSGSACMEGNPDLFVIRSFTKMYAMPGLRFGYGLCADKSLLNIMRQQLQPWNVSLVAQEAATAAAAEYEFARESAALTAQNREIMEAELRRAGFSVCSSCANFLLLRAPEGLADICLESGFLIRDCGNFPGLCRNGNGWAYFRVCVRSREENEALLRAMQRVYAVHEK